MSTPEPSPSTTAGSTHRPDWVALGNSGEQQILKWGGDPSAMDPNLFKPDGTPWKIGPGKVIEPPVQSPLTTGAFVSRAVSTRFEVQPSRWGNLGTMVVLYGSFIGIPVAAGAWAVLRILGQL